MLRPIFQTLLAAQVLTLSSLSGSYQVLNTISSYGWLDQYSMNTRHSYVGDEACVPTSSTNSMTYLQNVAPHIFGTHLTGVTYYDWMNTDDYMINIMGTTAGTGTIYNQFVYALNNYITQTQGYSEVQFSGMFPSETWLPPYSQPSYITTGKPDVSFITNAIAAGSGVLTSIEYIGGGGHEILVNGIEWDPGTNTGTLYFVDPLDPSQNYSPDVPLGPVKQTTGSIRIDSNGEIRLTYDQYAGSLPYDGSYNTVSAHLFGVLSVGGGAFTPFSLLLPKGNDHAIAEGFDILDPTTSAMFPLLAVLNTLPSNSLENAFQQMDPSIFSSILLCEQDIALQTRSILTSNLLQYLDPCWRQSCCSPGRIWTTPYATDIHRREQGHHSGYRSISRGIAGGADYMPSEDFLVGAGISYANTDSKWDQVNAHGNVQTYGGFLYGAFDWCDSLLDISFGYFSNKVHAKRHVYLATPVPFINPFSGTYTHHNRSSAFLAHLGSRSAVCNFSYCPLDACIWNFVNLDYLSSHQPRFNEKGDVIAYTVKRNNSTLFQPEVGLACSFYLTTPWECTPYLHTLFSYSQQIRLNGKHTHAYFVDNPDTVFTVSGLYPQNGIFTPTLILGIHSPENCCQLNFNLTYQGNFGAHLSTNSIAAEINAAF